MRDRCGERFSVRFFKHGDALAIALPDSVRQRVTVKEDEDYEFIAIEPGVLALVSRSALEQRVRSSLIAELGGRINGQAKTAPARQTTTTPSAPTSTAIIGPLTPDTVRDALGKQGYLVLDNENLMKTLAKPLERDVKDGKVIGVRAFDKRYYIVTSEYYSKGAATMARALTEGEKPVVEVAKACAMPEMGCMAVLQVMKDFGEVIEKKRGVYALVK